MKFKPINPKELEVFKSYLFKIKAAGQTVYTVGYLHTHNGYGLQKYQELVGNITHYAEIEP